MVYEMFSSKCSRKSSIAHQNHALSNETDAVAPETHFWPQPTRRGPAKIVQSTGVCGYRFMFPGQFQGFELAATIFHSIEVSLPIRLRCRSSLTFHSWLLFLRLDVNLDGVCELNFDGTILFRSFHVLQLARRNITLLRLLLWS